MMMIIMVINNQYNISIVYKNHGLNGLIRFYNEQGRFINDFPIKTSTEILIFAHHYGIFQP